MMRIKKPKGIRFADAESRKNFEAVAVGLHVKPNFRPIIVITGLPGSGKSTLARRILRSRAGEHARVFSKGDFTEEFLRRQLWEIVEMRYLLVDDVHRRVTSPTLAALVTGISCTFLRPGKSDLETLPCDVQIVLTGCGGEIEMSEELERRAIRIKLA